MNRPKALIRQIQLILLLFFYFSLTQVVLAQQAEVIAGLSTERLKNYEVFLENEVETQKIPGAVSLVFRKGKIVHDYQCGYSSLKGKKEMEREQIFYIQSMTKPIVTVAFMMLYEEGYFLLNDPVSHYLPQFQNIKVSQDINQGANGPTTSLDQEITIAHILSHTAGFSHGLGSSQLDKDIAKALYYEPHENIESRVNALISNPLISQPGQQWYYSASPDVLALLIEHFTKTPVDQFLQERIFDPLEMSNTGYNLSKKQQKDVVAVHEIDDNGKLVKREFQPLMSDNKVFGGTHALYSTASDYMNFCQMLLNGGTYKDKRILSPKTIDIMTIDQIAPVKREDGQGFGFGFGVLIDLAQSKQAGSVGQYYWSGANRTYFFIDPKEELIAILMTQVSPYSDYYGQKMRQFIYASFVE